MSKYQVGRRMSWTNQHDVRVTDHVLFDRWDRRTPADSVAPETAWEESIDVSPVAGYIGDEDATHDSARLYADTDCRIVFLVVSVRGTHDEIVTVLTVDMVRHGPTRAFLHAFADARVPRPAEG